MLSGHSSQPVLSAGLCAPAKQGAESISYEFFRRLFGRVVGAFGPLLRKRAMARGALLGPGKGDGGFFSPVTLASAIILRASNGIKSEILHLKNRADDSDEISSKLLIS